MSAAMLTGLVALFPPHLAWRRAGALAGVQAGGGQAGSGQAGSGQAGSGQAHFALPPERAPDADGAFQSPPPGPGRSGIMAFAGRQVVLPEGSWRTLVLARSGAPQYAQSVLLARIEGGALTGLLYAVAPDPLGHATGPLIQPSTCFDPRAIAGDVRPEHPATEPTVHECWELAPSRLLDLTRGDSTAEVPHDPLRAALHRLEDLHATLPPALLAATFFRSDATGWLSVAVLFPDERGRRVVAWARRYAAVFHRGFDGAAAAADAVRDPGAKGP